jgi:hypothetical protein
MRWIGGVVLILVGVVFLLQNFGMFQPTGNWWAVFMLIPVVILAGNAMREYRSAGDRLTPAARGSAAGALVLIVIALMFLFNLDWGRYWPLILIAAGIAALLGWAGRTNE